MSGSSLKETDPALQIYEAQAIIIEQNEEIRRLKQEIERFQAGNSNANQQGLVQKMEKLEKEQAVSKADFFQLSEQFKNLELAVNQSMGIVQRLEQDLTSKNNLIHRSIELQFKQTAGLQSNVNQLIAQQKKLAENVNEIRKESGILQNTSILVLGGRGPLNTIYLLDSKAQRWKKLSITLPVEMYSFGAIVLNEEIYIFGGIAKYSEQQECYKLKDDGSWIKLASLNQKRCNISSSSLVYKGDIWAIGGSSGYSREFLKSVEKYDISQDKWTYMPEMNYAKHYAAAAVFKDRIFVTGGRNNIALKSVEMFDPKLQKWILFCNLPIQVMSHTMLISNSTLSIFGGSSGSGPLNRVWEMDIEDPKKKWTEKQSFKHPRYDFGIGKLSNGIIVFGDWGESGDTSEIFDGSEWIDGPKLSQSLSYFAYTSIPRSLAKSFLNNFS